MASNETDGSRRHSRWWAHSGRRLLGALLFWSCRRIDQRPFGFRTGASRTRTLPRGNVQRDRGAAEHSAIRCNGRRWNRPQRACLSDPRDLIGGWQDTTWVSVLRTLRMQGHKTVVALKATGLPAIAEIAQYQDFGASQAFDPIDFGLPTTFPPGRPGIEEFLGKMLDFCFSLPADAVVVECAGDPVSANAPELLRCLKARRGQLTITLAAADALGAMGAKHALAEIGLKISLITGPCTDTAVLRQRTEALCGIPAINLSQGSAGEPIFGS